MFSSDDIPNRFEHATAQPRVYAQWEQRGYFTARLGALPNLKAVIVLGRVAHDQTLTTLALRKAVYPFRHGARHEVGSHQGSAPLAMFDSLHCSRLNTNTKRLTTEMFHGVFRDVRAYLDAFPGS